MFPLLIYVLSPDLGVLSRKLSGTELNEVRDPSALLCNGELIQHN